jgi:iron complex outermembrane recepter protein
VPTMWKMPLSASVSFGALIIGAISATPAAAQSAGAPPAGGGAAPGLTAPATAPTRPVIVTAMADQPAGTQPAGQATPPSEADAAQNQDAADIVVTGFRASLQSAVNQRRRSDQIIDAITAEDIADFPDANVAESIQRLPGVSIDRDNGEGRSITIRGLGGDFQLTRLNGADAQNVAGGSTSDAGANRSRGFDFNTFASELFGNITVTKSVAAVNDEGSLGAIVDLTTGRPLSYSHNRFLVGAEGEYRENGGTWNPRLTGLASFRVSDNFGILASVAYQENSQQIDRYARSIGQFEYTYRNSQINGVTPPTFGFARPSNQGTGATFGSDPAAYALVTPTTIIPALPSIGRQDLDYNRLGATMTMQWRPSHRTEIILDGVYSRYQQDSTTNALTPIGLNRNGTNARATILTGTNGLRAPNTANGLADRLALYPRCVPSATINCAGTNGSTTVLPGYADSYNPRNLNPYDYYNNPASPGYVANANLIGFYNELIGRPNTKIRQANVNSAGQADYLVLDDVDWRTSADAQFGTTNFYQGTLNLTHEFSNRFRMESTFGYSRSEFRAVGLLAEFNSIDRDNYTFDERGDAIMPVFSPGFDVADPSQWTLVKGLSTIRYFENVVNNEFRVARVNFAYTPNDEMVLRFGGTWKRFNFDSDQGRRSQDIEAINPTLQEAGLNITDLGRLVGFGQGLNVSQGTPTSFYAPDLDAFISRFGINCNCVNQWGDYRAVVDGRQRNSVQETDMSGFFQIDFHFDVAGRPMRGNAGVRVAHTEVVGNGNVGGTDGVLGIPVEAHNEYTDYLPSFNIVYEPVDDFLVRLAFSRTIARPQLASLTPGTTSFPNFTGGLNSAGAAPSVTVGNPYLSPFRAWNVDLSFEKYFGRGGLIAATLFHKTLDSFPQQIAGEVPLSSVFEPEIYSQLVAQFTNTNFINYINNGGLFAVRQFQDAPGGTIDGIEITAQTNFTFLPAPFDNFGVTANYTHIESELTYLTGAAVATRQVQAPGTTTAANSFATGPFLNTSPDAFNATLYYEDSTFSARISAAYRTRYVNRFPLASGTCSVGTTTNAGAACNSPIVADFGYTENTLNIDFASSWNVNRFLRLTLEGRNLTNSPTYRTMYEANPVTQLYQSTGRIITVGARVTF